jgi:hypothetical protein
MFRIYSNPDPHGTKNVSITWRRHHYRWKAATFRPMLGAQGLWAGRDLYRATPAVTRDLGFSSLIRRIAPFSRLLEHTRGCGEPILTQILTGPHSIASSDTQGDLEDLFEPGSSRGSIGEVNTVFSVITISPKTYNLSPGLPKSRTFDSLVHLGEILPLTVSNGVSRKQWMGKFLTNGENIPKSKMLVWFFSLWKK